MKRMIDERSAWSFRPVIVFATAYIIIAISHESAHALTAYALDIPCTLFPFAVELARDRGTVMQRVVIGVAGPLCALLIGLICWLCYRRVRGSRSELMLLFLATFGTGTFFGNLMSAAFVGDFSRAALALRLPITVRYVASLIGLLSICAVHFMAGWELRRLSPAGSSRLRAMILMVVFPAIAGMAIVTLSSLPMPSALIFGRLMEALFWIFGAAGVLMSRQSASADHRTLHTGWADVVVLAAAIIALRVMAVGIAFQR
jgi:hypothetical protein